jgi:hypothetical protein
MLFRFSEHGNANMYPRLLPHSRLRYFHDILVLQSWSRGKKEVFVLRNRGWLPIEEYVAGRGEELQNLTLADRHRLLYC